MTIASFLDICIDAADSDPLAGFWRVALRGSVTRHERMPLVRELTPGIADTPTVWINGVPESPPPVKTRVHLDVRLGAAEEVDTLIEAGATVLLAPRPTEKWWLMADPEGNEFCAFVPDGGPARLYELVVDARNAADQTTWWRNVLGGEVVEEGDYAAIKGAAGQTFEYLVFQNVPEPKTVKNRVHWDVTLTGPTPDALVEAGATVQRAPDDDISWWIMQDPEGNEFCAFPPEKS